MTELHFRIICYGLALILMLVTYLLWRVERVAGADRRLVTEAAERSEKQGGEEQRSVDDRRVTPGEAMAVAIGLRDRMIQQAANLRDEAEDCSASSLALSYSAYKERAAELLSLWAREWTLALELPEPDSDAVKPDDLDTTEGIPSANPLGNSCDERSGRRNGKDHAHE